MLSFSTEELKQEIIDCLVYVKEKQTGRGLQLDFPDLLSEDFDCEDYDDILVDENYEVSIFPDETNQEYYMTIREFIDMINESKEVTYHDTLKCITNKRALIRVNNCENEDIHIVNELLTLNSKILELESTINNKGISCSLVKGFTMYGLMRHFKKDYGDYYGSVIDTDAFIEIKYDELLSKDELNSIYNSYVFELSASHNINIVAEPRFSISELEDYDIELDTTKVLPLRPLLFGKGIEAVLEIFNKGVSSNTNPEYSIIQYTKVLEYVSQTVIREELNTEVFKKLDCPSALNPDANYIKELENLIVELNKKYEIDRGALKITIKTCCDILSITEYAPSYLSKVKSLKQNLEKTKANKEQILESAYDQLSDSISDTRNHLSHAKTNYVLKGLECPKADYEKFARMTKALAVQAIRWFARVHEDSRVI